MKKLLILSGKGGTGKTTTAAAFVQFASATAFADCDVDAPNLHLISQVSTEPVTKDFIGSKKAVIDSAKCQNCGICVEKCHFHAIKQQDNACHIDELACEGCGVCAYICPSSAVTLNDDIAGNQMLYTGETVFSTAKLKMGRGNSGKLVASVKLDLLKNAPDTELAIIDGSPGIGCPVISSVSGMDFVLIVAEASVSGLNDLKRLLKVANNFHVPVGICINKWDIDPEKSSEIEHFCIKNNLPFMGKIPYDPTVTRAMNQGKSIADIDCPAQLALKQIYQNTRAVMQTK